MRVFTALYDILKIPTQCLVCRFSHRQRGVICANCIVLLPKLKDPCIKCALPLASKDAFLCGSCLRSPFPIEACHVNYAYQGPLPMILHRYKYQLMPYLAGSIAQLMLLDPPPFLDQIDWIVPVPMHRRKLQSRGFHPTLEIAKRLAKALKIPCKRFLCHKTQNTAAQASLSKQQRSHNVSRSFTSSPIPGCTILIIDDLMTTGATTKALAKSLEQAGAKAVYCWTLARAL